MNLYANLRCTTLVFLQIPGLHMSSAAWTVLNWGDVDRDRGFKWDALPLGPTDPKKLSELPRFLHIVPDGVTFQQRRRQLLRRLAHKMTCGLVPANKGVHRVWQPVPKPVADATHATIASMQRLDPSPHMAAAWETVQHGAQKVLPRGPNDSPEGDGQGSGSGSRDSLAAPAPSDTSSRPEASTAMEAVPSTHGHGEEDGDEEYTVPGTRYTAAQARLLLSALHAWRYAKTKPGAPPRCTVCL